MEASEAILVLLSVFIMGIVLLLGVPGLLGYRWTFLMSGSMIPTINRGELVLLQPLQNASNIKIGDIVVFQMGDEIICHRVISINGSMVTTKGDSLRSTVETFPASLIKYKAVKLGENIVKIPLLPILVIFLILLLAVVSIHELSVALD